MSKKKPPLIMDAEYTDHYIDRNYPDIRHCLYQSVECFEKYQKRDSAENNDTLQRLISASERLSYAVRFLAMNSVYDRTESNMDIYRIAQENDLLSEEMSDITVGFTPEGYVKAIIPGMLPRKERGNTDGLEFYLYPKLLRFAKEHPDAFPITERQTICYFHGFSSTVLTKTGDLDNFERNFITDAFALFFMKDDNWRYLDYYAEGVEADDFKTAIYLVPSAKFSKFLLKTRKNPTSFLFEEH